MPVLHAKTLMVAGLALAALATGGEGEARKAKEPPPIVATGKPVDCIPTNQIRETRVRDDRTIDFYMRGGRTKLYRNVLPYACSGLGFEERFLYKTSINQLCSVDTITVLRTPPGAVQGPTCGLGKFQPATEAKR
ncbi:hypothetical protein CLG96_17260 [Sphingomonas oleivorans]|uniref:Uncharacterized protein n=1 Tax=Sphingomonas oleivorans TaxID=1735121 RepID=A0A2T5FTA4_9SPHN|nr:hypothetical protein [Sphingomonas oleivorans]PTQ07304.1 hypothetical protein CLG96_17260 [Sphingomonas oleivorans]